MNWTKKPTEWIEGRVLYVSIPFTWNLPTLKTRLMQKSFLWDRIIVGGPGIKLMPDFFNGIGHIEIQDNHHGALQKVNSLATKTTEGCCRSCSFCAVPKMEGNLKELSEWPDLPIIIDNNLLAASQIHFDRVIDRLIKWGWADFNQGLDARILSQYQARRIAEIKKPMIRLSLDNEKNYLKWLEALTLLLNAGIARKNIRSYALIGFDSDPPEAWSRCEFIESFGIKVLPQWFHRLDALKKNQVTEEQKKLGWTDYERRKIMQWFYKHKRAVK